MRLILAVVCIVALVVVVGRYFRLRDLRQDTEQTVVDLKQQTSRALHVLRRLQTTAATADETNDAARAERDRVRAVAAGLHENLSRARADTTAAEIGAFTSGAQANNLRACLTGVSQALNQLAVGDGNSIRSLQAVEAPCRAVGVV